MLYGAKTEHDFLMKDELEAMVKAHPDRFRLVYFMDKQNVPEGWTTCEYENSWVCEPYFSKYCFAPADDTCVFVCGVPPMYNSICGPRDVKEIAEGTIMHKLGYKDSSVFKF